MKRRLVVDAVTDSARRLEDAGVAFGQGTSDATQEAMWLAAWVLEKSWDDLVAGMEEPITAAQGAAISRLTRQRISTRKPVAYLIHEAWLGPYRFYVDERVIVPRSFIAELLRQEWTAKDPVSALDLCTGSGCLAILAALRWTSARVDAADVSDDALAVAKRNVTHYKLGRRVRLLKSDLFGALDGRTYDLILSNPPYVKASSMRTLPSEFRREPAMALASGADGLDHTRTILGHARAHLNPGGVLMVEIGHNRKALERAYPHLPFRWPRTSGGAGYVFTLNREELP